MPPPKTEATALLPAQAEQQPAAPAVSWYLYMLTGCAALNSINLGFDIGVTSGAILFIRDDLGLSELQSEMLVGSLLAASMIGAAFSGWLSDALGRRYAFTVSCFVFIVGVTTMVLSRQYAVLFAGRVVTGVGVGLGLAIDPTYIAECAPASHRGRLVTWSEIGINLGIVIGYSAGYAFGTRVPERYTVTFAWRAMLSCGLALPALLVVLSLTVMADSPRWLVMRGRGAEARRVLARVHGGAPAAADAEAARLLAEIEASVAAQAAYDAAGWRPLLRPSREVRRALLAGVGLAAAQQLTAVESLVVYLPFLLQHAGIRSQRTQLGMGIVMGVIKTLCIVASARWLDKAGRRPLLLLSLLACAAAHCVTAVGFFASPYAALAGAWLFMGAFSLGIGPGCWLLCSEIFPQHVRARAMSLCTITNRGISAGVASSFLTAVSLASYPGYFFVFGAVCVGLAAFVFFCVPETAGRSLEQLTADLATDEHPCTRHRRTVQPVRDGR